MTIENRKSKIFLVMGVSGSGKTTIGRMLADTLHLPFHDGDEYHPAENIAKMQAGIPLEDEDRYGWLQRLHALAVDLLQNKGGIIACSALKDSYRDILSRGVGHHFKWIHLTGDNDIIKSRMQERLGHFMPVDLLASQFAALEIPKNAICVSIDQSPERIVKYIVDTLTKAEIGIIGLGVMGRGLALNFAGKGISLSLYNRYVAGKEENIARDFINAHEALSSVNGFEDLAPFVESLQAPRKILLMVEAGLAIDTVLEHLSPLLSPGDLVADCGNSHYTDTQRRQELLAQRKIYFLGVGISGGEKGARYGPSIMPGGDSGGYAMLHPYFEAIAAKDPRGHSCCTYIGKDGSGHFVKMVHNGIEYAEMQLIAEVYSILRHGYGYDPDRIADIFTSWDSGQHRSFLLEITIQILRKREGKGWLLDRISDHAKSKGTGAWMLEAANALGVPSPVVAAAVHARLLSGRAEERILASGLQTNLPVTSAHPDETALAQAFCLARVINHHLGFELLRTASTVHDWGLDAAEIARIWTNGCIIRSTLMERLTDVLPESILHHPVIQADVQSMRDALSDFVIIGVTQKLHLPCHSASLNFLHGLTVHQPTGNLIQAQRDAFGAHGFQRTDDPSGRIHHF